MNYMTEIQGRWAKAKKAGAYRGTKPRYPFPRLAVGDGFGHPRLNSAVSLASCWHKKLGHRYDIIQLGVGAIVKRVA